MLNPELNTLPTEDNNCTNNHLEFSITRRGYLDRNGKLIGEPPAASREPQLLLAAYRNMVLTRALDKKAVALQRTGQMGTYAASLGQEAIGTAMGLTLRQEDVFVPSYREQACQLLRGIPMQQILQYWGGDERGNAYSGPQQDMPNCVPVATQMTHAAGIATAMRIRKQPRAVLVSCGDGATSRGDFYEALNVAGAWKLPMVAVINNNQWAISVRRRQQTVAPTLAQKAIAAGIPGVQVDGNDFVALYAVLSEALARAHAGNGSTLIEAVTYRLCDHTTADDATRYRSAEELSQAWQADPIKRLQTWLHNEGLWNAEKEQALQAEVKDQVQQAADDYLATIPQAPETMFDYLYETWPVSLDYQRDQLRQKLNIAARDNREDGA